MPLVTQSLFEYAGYLETLINSFLESCKNKGFYDLGGIIIKQFKQDLEKRAAQTHLWTKTLDL